MSIFKTFAQDFKQLPPVIRGIIWLVGIGAVVGSAVGVYMAYKRAKDKAQDKEEANTVVDEVRHLENQGIKPSYPDSQYKAWANVILNAVNARSGCIPDETGVSHIILKIKNDVDWLKLVAAFSIKKVTGCGFVSDRECTLQQALNWKLQQMVIDAINIFFEKRGSKYRI